MKNNLLKGFTLYRRRGRGTSRGGNILILKSGWITLPNPFIDKFGVEKADSCSVYFDRKGRVAFRFYFDGTGNQKVRMRGGKYSCGMCIRGLTRQLDFIAGLYIPTAKEKQKDGSLVVLLEKEKENE